MPIFSNEIHASFNDEILHPFHLSLFLFFKQSGNIMLRHLGLRNQNLLVARKVSVSNNNNNKKKVLVFSKRDKNSPWFVRLLRLM